MYTFQKKFKALFFVAAVISAIACCLPRVSFFTAFAEETVNPDDVVESVDCAHAQIAIEGDTYPGGLTEITVSDFEDGYALDYVLVSCGGQPVVTERNGNAVSFIMPDGKISVKVVFKESVSPQAEREKKKLGTKEIIAIVASSVVLFIGGAIILIKERKKKNV